MPSFEILLYYIPTRCVLAAIPAQLIRNPNVLLVKGKENELDGLSDHDILVKSRVRLHYCNSLQKLLYTEETSPVLAHPSNCVSLFQIYQL